MQYVSASSSEQPSVCSTTENTRLKSFASLGTWMFECRATFCVTVKPVVHHALLLATLTKSPGPTSGRASNRHPPNPTGEKSGNSCFTLEGGKISYTIALGRPPGANKPKTVQREIAV